MGRYFIEERDREKTLYYQPYDGEWLAEEYFKTPVLQEQMGLVQAKQCNYDSHLAVCYAINGMTTIEEAIKEGIEEEELIKILTTMADTAEVLRSSNVPMERVLFHMNCIFAYQPSKEVFYVLHTGSYALQCPDFFSCVREVLLNVQINNVQYGVDKFIENYLNGQTQRPSFIDFSQYLRNIRSQLFLTKEYSGQQSLSCRLGDSNIMIDELFSIEAPKFSTVRMMEQETEKKHVRLVRKRTGEEIEITKAIFTIGKAEEVDYRITDNPAISRKHADIICREDGYYIKDLDSTNHTFLNHRLVKARTEVRLEDGADIMLANEMFVYYEQ